MQASNVKRKVATKTEVTKPKEVHQGNPVKEGPHTVKPSTTTTGTPTPAAPPKKTNDVETETDEKPAKIAEEEKKPVGHEGDAKHLPGEDVPSGTLEPSETEATRSQVTPDTEKAEITQHNYAVVPNNNVPGTETNSTPRTDEPGSGQNPSIHRNGRQMKGQSAAFPDEAKVHRRSRSGVVLSNDDASVASLRADLERASEAMKSANLRFATPQSHPAASPGLPVAPSALDIVNTTLGDFSRA